MARQVRLVRWGYSWKLGKVERAVVETLRRRRGQATLKELVSWLTAELGLKCRSVQEAIHRLKKRRVIELEKQ